MPSEIEKPANERSAGGSLGQSAAVNNQLGFQYKGECEMSESKQLSTGSEDTAHVSFYCTWRAVNALDELHSAKMAARRMPTRSTRTYPPP